MGNSCPCWEPEEPRASLIQLKLISTNTLNTPFMSDMLSAAIKDSEAKKEVEDKYSDFLKEQNEMEIHSRQGTSISREIATKTLIKWETELNVKLDHYSYLKKLHEVLDNPQDWSKHVGEAKLVWEKMQRNNAKTNWLYFYVKRTESDVNKFDMAICHLITNKIGVYSDVLIGGLCKEDLLHGDSANNVYLTFDRM